MTDRVAFTHAMRASHQADIRDWEVPGGPKMVMWALYDQVGTEPGLIPVKLLILKGYKGTTVVVLHVLAH